MKNSKKSRYEIIEMDSFPVGFCTKADICALYGITYVTLRNALKPHMDVIGSLHSRHITPRQVELIFRCLGVPFVLTAEEERRRQI